MGVIVTTLHSTGAPLSVLPDISPLLDAVIPGSALRPRNDGLARDFTSTSDNEVRS